MRRWLVALESWIFDDESMLLGVLKMFAVLGLSLLCVVWVYVTLVPYTAFDDCMARGGAWRRSGSYVVPVMAGKIMTMQTHYRYRCEP